MQVSIMCDMKGFTY